MIATLQRAWRMLAPDERRFFVRLAGLSAVNAILEIIGAGLIFSLVDSLQHADAAGPAARAVRDVFPDASPHDVVYILCAVTGVFYLVKSFSGVTETYLRNRRINSGAASMNKQLLRSYLHAPLTFHHAHASADLVRTGFYSTDAMYRGAVISGAQLLSELLAAATLLLVMIVASPIIAPLVLGIMGSVLVVSYRLFRRRLRAWGEAAQTQYGRCYNLMSEAIRGYRDIRLHEADEHFLSGFTHEREQLAGAWTSSDTASQSSRFLLETVFVLSVVVLVIALVATSGDSSKTTALLALYGYAGFRLMPSANRALQAIGYISTAAPAVELIESDLHALALVRAEDAAAAASGGPASDRPPLQLTEAIDVRGLCFTFPGAAHPALRGIDLHIGRGESIGIVGSSGAGKSTFVDLLVGLLTPDAGSLRVDGQDIAGRIAEWHHLLGYVSQSTFLLDASLRENIAFGIDRDAIDEPTLMEAVGLAQLDALVAELPEGLDTVVGENGVRLSGGQRQRIAIARALYTKPQLLVFDEATSALDNATEAELTAGIEKLAGDRTIVIIAHRLTTVRRCNRIFLLREGVVADTGTFDDLLSRSEEFRQLSRLPVVDAGAP